MSYLTQPPPTARPGPIATVVVIHAALGFALVTGLATTIIDPPFVPNPRVTDVPDVVVPIPPEPEPTVEPRDTQPRTPPPFVPPAPNPFPTSGPTFAPGPPADGPIVRDPGPVIGGGSGTLPKADPAPPVPAPTFQPTAAKPSNDPASWVTQADYRSSWLRRGWEGTATFRLSVGANGRVTDCAIVTTSGHTALDDATCGLVTRRARFDPALNRNQKPVAGSYSSAVRWQIPQ